MTNRFSVYLDFLRFAAAIIVFLSHYAYARFTDGYYLIIRELNLGSDAVVFFFVLSGLVIAYTTDVKDKTLKDYIFHRVTRLYSVIIPALFLTIILDMWGNSIAPENYNGWWFNDAPAWEQFLRGVTLTNEWANQHFRVGTNGPYWSLSYEAAYYILFGIGFYVTGLKKYILLLLLVLIFGFPVMALFPTWLLGVWAYKRIKAKELSISYAWRWALLPPVFYMICLYMNLPAKLLLLTQLLLGVDFVSNTLWFSNEFIWNLIIAKLVAFHLVGMSVLFKSHQDDVSELLSRPIRWCAGATFTIYIVHYPALQFIDAVLPELSILLRHILMLLLVLGVCFLFAEVSERRLKWLRNKFKTYVNFLK